MEPKIAACFNFLDTAEEVWQATKDLYGEQYNIARMYQLCQTKGSLKKGTAPINEYIGTFKGIWDEIDVHAPLTTDLSIAKKQREQEHIFEILAGLPNDYENLRSQILMAHELPSLSSVCALFIREESRRKAMGTLNCNDQEVSNDEKAAFAVNSYSSDSRNFRGKRDEGRKLKCSHCKKVGHSRDTCWFIHGKPDRGINHIKSTSNGTFKKENIFSGNIKKENNQTSLITSSSDKHITLETLAEMIKELQVEKTAGISINTSDHTKGMASISCLDSSSHWIVDSGATNHMAKRFTHLYSPHSVDGIEPVAAANGAPIADWINEPFPVSFTPQSRSLFANIN
ncbi:hypothetical protein EJ110_NYTH25715 [Nymphaea thermarum]|nr:hypothetical protein EJ110_NYTH25715 [Nymphaea thermarum]